MIRLYRYDGLEFLLNVDLISEVNTTPETVITLTSGEKIRVKNTDVDVITKIKAFRLGMEAENRDVDESDPDSMPGRRSPAR